NRRRPNGRGGAARCRRQEGQAGGQKDRQESFLQNVVDRRSVESGEGGPDPAAAVVEPLVHAQVAGIAVARRLDGGAARRLDGLAAHRRDLGVGRGAVLRVEQHRLPYLSEIPIGGRQHAGRLQIAAVFGLLEPLVIAGGGEEGRRHLAIHDQALAVAVDAHVVLHAVVVSARFERLEYAGVPGLLRIVRISIRSDSKRLDRQFYADVNQPLAALLLEGDRVMADLLAVAVDRERKRATIGKVVRGFDCGRRGHDNKKRGDNLPAHRAPNVSPRHYTLRRALRTTANFEYYT